MRIHTNQTLQWRTVDFNSHTHTHTCTASSADFDINLPVPKLQHIKQGKLTAKYPDDSHKIISQSLCRFVFLFPDCSKINYEPCTLISSINIKCKHPFSWLIVCTVCAGSANDHVGWSQGLGKIFSKGHALFSEVKQQINRGYEYSWCSTGKITSSFT